MTNEISIKLAKAFKKAGFPTKTIKIVLTPQDIRRRKEVREFIKGIEAAHEATKKSTLRFGLSASQ